MWTPLQRIVFCYFRHTHCWQVEKSSTQPCSLHRQTLAVEWAYWRPQWLSTWHRHRMPPFQQISSSNFCPARAAPVNCKCCYCEVDTSRRNNSSAQLHKLIEWDRHVLKRKERKNCLSSVATLTTKFQTASGSNANTITVRRELHDMGFHGWAAHKPKITMRNAKCRLEWYKACRN